jgi:low affinity Fe/Cu permease
LAIALSVSRITAMTVVMGAIIFWTDFECIHRISDIERLVVGVTVGVVAYLGLCVLTRDEAFFELLDIFGVRRKQKHEVIDVKVP